MEARRLILAYEFDSARTVLGTIPTQPQTVPDSTFAVRRLGLLAQMHYRLGEYDAVRDTVERVLALAAPLELWDQIARAHSLVGLSAWQESDPFSAVAAYDRARDAASHGAEPVTRNAIENNRTLVQMDLGRYDIAMRDFAAVAATAEELGDARVGSAALTNLGMAALWMGEPDLAVPPLEEALPLARAAGDAAIVTNALGQLGLAYAALGEPGRAVAILDSAVTQSRALNAHQEEASNLEALASVLDFLGDGRGALAALRTAATIDRHLGLEWELAANLRSTAAVHASLGNLELAIAFTDSARQLHQTLEYPQEELADLLQLAELARQQEHGAEAAAYLTRAESVATTVDSRNTRVQFAITRAQVILDQDPARALRTLAAAEEDLGFVGYGAVWRADDLRARALERLGRNGEAVAAARRAVEALEATRANLASGTLRSRLREDRRDTYSHLVALLHQEGLVDEAFTVVDRFRRHEPGPGHRDSGSPADTDSALVALEVEIAGLDEFIRAFEIPGDDGADERGILQALEDSLAALRRTFETATIASRERSGRGAARAPPSGPAHDPSAIQAILGPHETLIEYFLARDELFTFVLTSTDVTLHRVAVSQDDLSNRVRLARQLMSRPEQSPSGATPVLEGLHDLLLPPLRDDVAELTIVADGALHYLPFAALRDRETGRYLIERFALGSTPSAATLASLRERTGEATRKGGEVFVPFPDRLPGSEVEALAVRNAIAGSRIHRGRRAGERAVRQALQRSRPIHLATHARMNARSPLFSRIELTPGRRDTGPDDDGFLEVHEVRDMRIGSPLVFLSGCETGLGAWSGGVGLGEDVATLAAVFLSSGAANVVATLWPIEDAGAANLAEWFYRALESGGPRQALQRAQRRALNTPDLRAPFYWAGYQLLGRGN